ncbi:MAG: bifunctional phosphopantothenoylcysteine decarboxylase/phosphopantothenate--cysteine ligase CoaBC [archaeon]
MRSKVVGFTIALAIDNGDDRMDRNTYTKEERETQAELYIDFIHKHGKLPDSIDSLSEMYNIRSDKNDDTAVGQIGTHLEGKKIAIVVSGGIAAYKAPSLARHYRQYGAEITFYPTKDALRFITEIPLGWSSAGDVITELTGKAEHLYEYDAYIVAPATLNIIGDIANGRADDMDPAKSLLTSAFGRIQDPKNTSELIIAPAMHGSMYENPALKKNLEFLKEYGVKQIGPEMKNNKANLKDTHSIVAYTIRELSDDPLKGKDILVNAGPCWAKIDNVRAITNIFRGRLGIEIAEELYLRGANVRLIYGPGGLDVPRYIDTMNVRYYEDMYDAVIREIENHDYDAGIFSSAIPDYKPKNVFDGKIKSEGGMNMIELDQTEKIIKKVRQKRPDLHMTTFKLETGITEDQLLDIGYRRLKDYEIVVANLLDDMSSQDHTIHPSYIMEKTGRITRASTKKGTAGALLDTVGAHLEGNIEPQTLLQEYYLKELHEGLKHPLASMRA